MANRKHEEQLETTTVFCGHCGSWTRHTPGPQPQCLEPTHTSTHVHKAVRVDDVIGDVAYRWCACGARSECAPDGSRWSLWQHVEPSQRPAGALHEHERDRWLDFMEDACACGATRKWERRGDNPNRVIDVWPLAWVEPVAAADEPSLEAQQSDVKAANLESETVYLRGALATALTQIASLRAELACVYETQDELVSALERAARKRVAFLVPE